jgi:hypothetical protein
MHNWTERGEYEIRVKAKDTWGNESEWSDPLVVTMPKINEHRLERVTPLEDKIQLFRELIRTRLYSLHTSLSTMFMSIIW